ncbi:MAG TPA: hypothetical protein VJP77_02320 [Planctomycetota bacterium]|nr:hypothetical protein [Planctomycetota bacterium]
MCPVCLAVGGLYVAGGVSAGAVATFLTAKRLRARAAPAETTPDTEPRGDDRDVAEDRIES